MLKNENNIIKLINKTFKPGNMKGGMPEKISNKDMIEKGIIYYFVIAKYDGITIDYGFDYVSCADNLMKTARKYGFVYFRMIDYIPSHRFCNITNIADDSLKIHIKNNKINR